jgi:hypothetical protein
MTSDEAKILMDKWSIGVEGGPDILSDYDVKNFLPKDAPGIEQMGYVVKLQVRNGTVNHTSISFTLASVWNIATAQEREMLKTINNLHVVIGMRDTLTSAQYSTCPVCKA